MAGVEVVYYDRCNLGDDLLVKALADRYVDRFAITLRRPNPAIAALPNVAVHVERPWQRVARLVARQTGRPHAPLQRRLRSADLLVRVGGSIFIEGPSLDPWRRERAFYASCPVPYLILGANFGPHRSPEFVELVGDICAGAEDVCFRDRASFERFEDRAPVRWATDLGLAVDPAPYAGQATEDRAVVSVVDARRRFGEEAGASYEAALRTGIEHLVAGGTRVSVLSFCAFEGDLATAQAVVAGLDPATARGVEVVDYQGDLDAALRLVARARVVVGSRFHAVVLAVLFGIPVLPVPYSHKTTDLLDDLGHAGPHLDAATLTGPALVDALRAGPPTIGREGLRARAERQFERLDQRLTRAR